MVVARLGPVLPRCALPPAAAGTGRGAGAGAVAQLVQLCQPLAAARGGARQPEAWGGGAGQRAVPRDSALWLRAEKSRLALKTTLPTSSTR